MNTAPSKENCEETGIWIIFLPDSLKRIHAKSFVKTRTISKERGEGSFKEQTEDQLVISAKQTVKLRHLVNDQSSYETILIQ